MLPAMYSCHQLSTNGIVIKKASNGVVLDIVIAP
jgi:hypothetical protein